MRSRIMPIIVAAVLIGLPMTGTAGIDPMWAKGNMHTHTTNSDGDSEPQVVVDWYKDHGYQFLFVTDHGKVTDPTPLDKPDDDFVLIPGEETSVKGAKKPIHGCALGITTAIPATEVAATPAKSLAKMVQEIRQVGGIPQINHPNFVWSFGYAELKTLQGPYLLEVFNGHPSVHNVGSESHMPVEQTWDMLLSDGVTVYATATDDEHCMKTMAPEKANPGRGWVCVRRNERSAESILSGLHRGDFYASTGVELIDYGFDGKTLNVRVAPKDGQRYWIRFVGKYGRILQETTGTSASWTMTTKAEPNDYVRCKVIGSDGKVAWTQAFRFGGGSLR